MLPEGRLSGSLKAMGCPGLKARFFWRGRVHGLKPPFDSVAYATSLRAGCGFYRCGAGAPLRDGFVDYADSLGMAGIPEPFSGTRRLCDAYHCP
jgi:hypothetical protein